MGSSRLPRAGFWRVTFGLACAAFAGACGSEPPEVSGDLTLERVFIEENTDNVLSYFVEWQTEVPASTELELDCGEALRESFRDETLATSHELFVMGLLPETDCTFALRSVSEDGVVGEARQTITVRPLPALLPTGFEVVAREPDAMEPGWTLLNFINSGDGQQLSVAFLDDRGRIRWYTDVGTERFNTLVTEVSVQPEGVLVGGNGEIDPTIIRWDGETVWSMPWDRSHHDIRRDLDAMEILYPVDRGSCGGFDYIGGVERVDMRTRETIWAWDICEHFVPDEYVHDWAHINTVDPLPGEGAFLLSLRNQDSILKVDEASGDVIWHLGRAGDFTFGDGAAFEVQHASDMLSDGHLLLFDNGSAREYSRALELVLDETAMTAELAWEYVPPERWWTPIWGDADRLDNGNTLINFGQSDPAQHAHVEEVTRDGRRVWLLRYPLRWASYRADRVPRPRLIQRIDDLAEPF